MIPPYYGVLAVASNLVDLAPSLALPCLQRVPLTLAGATSIWHTVLRQWDGGPKKEGLGQPCRLTSLAANFLATLLCWPGLCLAWLCPLAGLDCVSL